jgi:hypothetical protein
MQVAFVRSSKNRKTGPMPISMSPKVTCPASCPLRGDGCYAEYGPLGWHWDRLSSGETGINWRAFLEAVRNLPRHALWRHNVSGDLPGKGEKLNTRMLSELVEANRGKRGFTYSHKHTRPENLAAIRAANQNGFTVNLSANTPGEADALSRKKAGPVVVILRADAAYSHVERTPAGRKVIICPQSYRDDVQCVNCGLCADPKRTAIIAFPAHGPSFRRAERIALGMT